MAVLIAALATHLPARLVAQPVDSTQTTPPDGHDASLTTPAARLVLPVIGATTGTHLAGTPDRWARTAGGFARRLGDQAGFFLVKESVQAALRRRTGWRTDTRRCRSAVTVVPCASARVLRLQHADGSGRWNLPLLAGVITGTAVSLAWRPERRQSGTDLRRFVITRVGFSVGIPIIGRAAGELRWRNGGGEGERR